MIYAGAKLEMCKDVYQPSDDSFLLADNIKVKRASASLTWALAAASRAQ